MPLGPELRAGGREARRESPGVHRRLSRAEPPTGGGAKAAGARTRPAAALARSLPAGAWREGGRAGAARLPLPCRRCPPPQAGRAANHKLSLPPPCSPSRRYRGEAGGPLLVPFKREAETGRRRWRRSSRAGDRGSCLPSDSSAREVPSLRWPGWGKPSTSSSCKGSRAAPSRPVTPHSQSPVRAAGQQIPPSFFFSRIPTGNKVAPSRERKTEPGKKGRAPFSPPHAPAQLREWKSGTPQREDLRRLQSGKRMEGEEILVARPCARRRSQARWEREKPNSLVATRGVFLGRKIYEAFVSILKEQVLCLKCVFRLSRLALHTYLEGNPFNVNRNFQKTWSLA